MDIYVIESASSFALDKWFQEWTLNWTEDKKHATYPWKESKYLAKKGNQKVEKDIFVIPRWIKSQVSITISIDLIPGGLN